MSDQEVLKLHINPKNRRVSITDPEYIEAWKNALEVRREEIKAELRTKRDAGEIEIPVVEHSPDATLNVGQALSTTPEDALHFMAHTQAEQEMQDWALCRGIGGMVGVNSGYDHGQAIEYIDDEAVPFLDFKVEEAA